MRVLGPSVKPVYSSFIMNIIQLELLLLTAALISLLLLVLYGTLHRNVPRYILKLSVSETVRYYIFIII